MGSLGINLSVTNIYLSSYFSLETITGKAYTFMKCRFSDKIARMNIQQNLKA